MRSSDWLIDTRPALASWADILSLWLWWLSRPCAHRLENWFDMKNRSRRPFLARFERLKRNFWSNLHLVHEKWKLNFQKGTRARRRICSPRLLWLPKKDCHTQLGGGATNPPLYTRSKPSHSTTKKIRFWNENREIGCDFDENCSSTSYPRFERAAFKIFLMI